MWLKVLGEAELQVQYGGQRYESLLRVVKEDRPSLIGGYWPQHIKLELVSYVPLDQSFKGDKMVKTLIHKYADVFKTELDKMKDNKATLVLKAGAVTKFIRPRSIPFEVLKSKDS